MVIDLSQTLFALDCLGTAVFAIAGVLAAAKRNLDLFGVVIVGTTTAVGGGTLRDLILGRIPVFWVEHTFYVWIAVLTSVLVFFFAPRIPFPRRTLLVADAFGLAIFTVIGANIAIALGHAPLIIIGTAVLTGCGGGVLRDVLTATKPLIMEKEIYATAALVGGVLYVTLNILLPNVGELLPALATIATVFAIRLGAIYWNLQLPVFLIIDPPKSNRPPEA